MEAYSMIQIQKKEIKACCGKKKMLWVLNTPIKKEHIGVFQQSGFTFLRSYYDAGMMYIEDNGLIATCVFGLNEIKIKCKSNHCGESAQLLENIILTKL